jgi:hypothetical protein
MDFAWRWGLPGLDLLDQCFAVLFVPLELLDGTIYELSGPGGTCVWFTTFNDKRGHFLCFSSCFYAFVHIHFFTLFYGWFGAGLDG